MIACFYKDYNYVGFQDHRADNGTGTRYNILFGDYLSSFLWETHPQGNQPFCNA